MPGWGSSDTHRTATALNQSMRRRLWQRPQRRIERYPNSVSGPLVFLILPVTILFAVFPGLMVLRLGF